MKKMLIMAKSLGGGGTEVALVEFINHLNLDQFDVTLALLDHDSEYEFRLKRKVKIEQIKYKYKWLKFMISMDSKLFRFLKKIKINKYFNYYGLFYRYIDNNFQDFDVAIDFYNYGYFLNAYLAERIHARKKVFWIHDEKMDWIQNVERYFNEYDKVYGVGKSVVNEFNRRYPNLSHKSRVFYNFYDVENIRKLSNRPVDNELDDKFTIVTVGRLHEQKGIDIAIEAASQLKRKGIDFVWYVIGDGPQQQKLVTSIKNKKIADNFKLLGRKDNPYSYMAKADVYVQPSRHEGYCTTTMEAKIIGKVVLTSDLDSFNEQFTDGLDGYILDKNPSSFVKVISDLYNNPESIKKIEQRLKNEKFESNESINEIQYLGN